jgi:hypothetical protein
MSLYIPPHLPLATYMSTALIIATGSCFAVLCLAILLVEFIVKLLVVPVIFLFTIGCLSYGFLKREILQPVWNQVPAHS